MLRAAVDEEFSYNRNSPFFDQLLVFSLAYSAEAAAKAGRPNQNLPAIRLEGLLAFFVAGRMSGARVARRRASSSPHQIPAPNPSLKNLDS
jgi:hypothetical protein